MKVTQDMFWSKIVQDLYAQKFFWIIRKSFVKA